ncbi:MAG: hypothetical protein C0399_12815 [Syntrophus sp. (in: bacteria)]|nr:hypothetical protein [Syntrophus sp. (in: bacteria)]
MTPEQITTVITGVLQGGGLATFAFYLIRALKQKIKGLEGTIGVLKGTVDAQKGTLDAMREQVSETKRVTDLYRDLVSNLPNDIANLSKAHKQATDQLSHELQAKMSGLEATVNVMKGTLDAQKGTLDAMREQVLETQRITGLYRDLISNLPNDLQNLSKVHKHATDVLADELEQVNRYKATLDATIQRTTISARRVYFIRPGDLVPGELPEMPDDNSDTTSNHSEEKHDDKPAK